MRAFQYVQIGVFSVKFALYKTFNTFVCTEYGSEIVIWLYKETMVFEKNWTINLIINTML